MGPAIASLRPAVRVSLENPVFLGAALLTLVGSGAASLLAGRLPVVGELVNSVLVTPAIAALMLGMAAAGLATDAASVGDGVESLRANYRNLVGGYALVVAGVLAIVLAWAVEVAVVVVVSEGVGVDPAALDPVALARRGPVVGLTLLALGLALVGGLAVQFFDVAIVVDGASARSSFVASARLLREAPGSVLGYSVLRMLPVVGAGVVVAATYAWGTDALGSPGGLLLTGMVAAAVGPVTFAFITAYHVAYYDHRVGPSVGMGGADRLSGRGRSSRSSVGRAARRRR